MLLSEDKNGRLWSDEIVCPYCGHLILSSLNDIFSKEIVYESDDLDYICDKCNNEFNITIAKLYLGAAIEGNEEDYGSEIEGFEVYIWSDKQ